MNQFKQIPIGKAEDLTGQRSGYLTALYRVEGKKTPWLCQCDCGNQIVVTAGHFKSQHTKSCGCFYQNSIVGQKFGKLTVLSYDRTEGKGHTYWNCECECGTIKSIRKDGLVSGKTISCGCYHKEETSKRRIIDLTNSVFGELEVLSYEGTNKFNSSLWLCQCSCGNQKIIDGQALRRGLTKSCGCVKSQGQKEIRDILRINNISFSEEQTFNSCKFKDSNRLARFDFYINNSYLIEFDGIQHFKSSTGWNTQEKFEKTQEHDKIKSQWCKENNIPLIRIPYTQQGKITIEDLMLETSQFICKGE